MSEQNFVTSPRSCSMNDSLTRKLSDTSSSESTVVPVEDGCGSCIIDFLHLRSHAVDAVVDDNTKKEDSNMTVADMIMINADRRCRQYCEAATNVSREQIWTTLLSITIARRRDGRKALGNNSTAATSEKRRRPGHYHQRVSFFRIINASTLAMSTWVPSTISYD